MHYKNGREAISGDPVILKDFAGNTIVGTIHSLNAGSVSCNATVAVVVPGGVNQFSCVTVGECYHAEDALVALDVATQAAVDAANALKTDVPDAAAAQPDPASEAGVGSDAPAV